MQVKSESLLRMWNALALVMIGLVAAIPRQFLPESPPNALGGYVFAGASGLLMAGFYFRMLFECVFAKGLSRRAWWIVFFFLLPVFSAFIYFASTRSLGYEARATAHTDGTLPARDQPGII